MSPCRGDFSNGWVGLDFAVVAVMENMQQRKRKKKKRKKHFMHTGSCCFLVRHAQMVHPCCFPKERQRLPNTRTAAVIYCTSFLWGRIRIHRTLLATVYSELDVSASEMRKGAVLNSQVSSWEMLTCILRTIHVDTFMSIHGSHDTHSC